MTPELQLQWLGLRESDQQLLIEKTRDYGIVAIEKRLKLHA